MVHAYTSAEEMNLAKSCAESIVAAPDIIASMHGCEDWRWYEGSEVLNLAFRFVGGGEAATEAYLELRVGPRVIEVSYQNGVVRTDTGATGRAIPMIQATIERMPAPDVADAHALRVTRALLCALPEPMRRSSALFLEAVDRSLELQNLFARVA